MHLLLVAVDIYEAGRLSPTLQNVSISSEFIEFCRLQSHFLCIRNVTLEGSFEYFTH